MVHIHCCAVYSLYIWACVTFVNLQHFLIFFILIAYARKLDFVTFFSLNWFIKGKGLCSCFVSLL